MKKFILFILFTVTLGFWLSSCKPSETPAPNNNNWPKDWAVPQEVLDYYYFKAGSMWVYENDKNGQLDTVVVKQSTKKWGHAQNDEKYEVAETILYSFLEGYNYSYYISMQGASACIKDGSSHPCYILFYEKYKPGDVLGGGISWIFPFQKGYGGAADYSSQTSNLKIIDIYDSLIINTAVYHNIGKINVTNAHIYYRKDINVLWAKDVGIVRKENLTDNETWNLIYHNIIK